MKQDVIRSQLICLLFIDVCYNNYHNNKLLVHKGKNEVARM